MTNLDLSKHGIDASQLAIRADEIDEFNRFLSGLFEDLRPTGEIQRSLFGQILHACWNMRIARREEAKILLADGPAASSLKPILQFYVKSEREYHKALTALSELQTELAYRATLSSEQATPLPDIPPLVRTAHVHRLVRTTLGPNKTVLHTRNRMNRSGG